MAAYSTSAAATASPACFSFFNPGRPRLRSVYVSDHLRTSSGPSQSRRTEPRVRPVVLSKNCSFVCSSTAPLDWQVNHRVRLRPSSSHGEGCERVHEVAALAIADGTRLAVLALVETFPTAALALSSGASSSSASCWAGFMGNQRDYDAAEGLRRIEDQTALFKVEAMNNGLNLARRTGARSATSRSTCMRAKMRRTQIR